MKGLSRVTSDASPPVAHLSSRRRAAERGVRAVVDSPGRPLDAATRAWAEARFAHDFSHVRVHADERAAASAHDLDAHAYTLGNHIVFGAGGYAPVQRSGRRLLAHELAHVVQQRRVVQCKSVSPILLGSPADQEEREAEEAARTVTDDEDHARGGRAVSIGSARALVVRRQAIGKELESSSWPEKDIADCIRHAALEPAECDPSVPLTWADFTATPPGSSTFSAETWSDLRERDMNVATFTCTPDLAAGLPSRGLQAWFDPARSWVRPRFANPGNPALNGCAAHVATCERFFDSEAAAGRTGGRWSLATAVDPACPAGAPARGDAATKRGECATVVATDCADREAAESVRLLRHEQGHFDLSCAMARKGNAMLATAPSLGDLLTAARTALSAAQSRYDSQTNHGCNASAQASWETNIAAGLPAVTITFARPRGRRRRP